VTAALLFAKDGLRIPTCARRPVALFIPVAAIVFSLKNCEGYIRAILIKQLENDKLSRGAGKRLSPRGLRDLVACLIPAWWLLLFLVKVLSMQETSANVSELEQRQSA